MSGPHWVCPCSRRVCFHCLQCSGSRLVCRELSWGGPRLRALPRSKALRFSFSSTPQRHRLGWTCVLYPSQVREAQVTRGLGSTVAPEVDRPESQEVLVSNEACLHFGTRCLSGATIAPSSSGCPRLPVSGGGWAGPQLASSAQSFVL